MFEATPKYFPNLGWLETKLSADVLNFLNECIKDEKENWNNNLTGNIEKSFIIKDKNDFFFKNVLVKCIAQYIKEFSEQPIPMILTRNCAYVLTKMWVNYQKKAQFNPMHHHEGVFSFVIWINLPSSFKEEAKIKFIKHSNAPSASTFQFQYANSLGQIQTYSYKLDSTYEGTMLFFPSQLNHQVYPFYTSNKNRISISGNIGLDPDEREYAI